MKRNIELLDELDQYYQKLVNKIEYHLSSLPARGKGKPEAEVIVARRQVGVVTK